MGFWDQWSNAEREVEEEDKGVEISEAEFAALADAGAFVAEIAASLKANFVGVGFTEEQAGDMVVAMKQETAAEAWAVARGIKEPE